MPYHIERPVGIPKAFAAVRAVVDRRDADGVVDCNVTARPQEGVVLADVLAAWGGAVNPGIDGSKEHFV